jgi:hypothetical protein
VWPGWRTAICSERSYSPTDRQLTAPRWSVCHGVVTEPITTTTTLVEPTTAPGQPGTDDNVRHAFLVRRDHPLPPPGTICKTVCGTEAPFPADAQLDKIPANVCPLCAWVWEDSGLPG